MIKLALKNRIKVLMSGSIDEYVRDFLSGNDFKTDESISTERAMKYSAVSSCVRVRAETFASVPINIYKKNKDGRDVVTDLPLYDILHYAPNDEMAPFGFKETLMTNFDVGGNIVCEKLINKSGELVGLYPYNHTAVKIERDKNTKKLVYKIQNEDQEKILKRENVLHVPNLSFDGIMGLSPISYAAQTILLGLSYESYGVNFYKNAAMPSGAFRHPNKLSELALNRLKKDLRENYTGLRNTGTPLMLEEGMDWTQITINPIDAQLLENKYFQIEDICRIYRVPQHLVNKLDRSTFNNIEHLSLEFVMYTMLPIFKRFEDNMNMQLLSMEKRKTGIYVEAKIDGLLRGDAKSRAEAYSIGRLGGWLSVNDIRRFENMPSIPNGNIYLQPMNYIEAGNSQDQTTAYNKTVEEIYNLISERRVE
jgi:HK97 family phage portal protein